MDAPWDIGLSRAKTERLAGPLHTKALEERPASPQDGATKPDKKSGRRMLLPWKRQILDVLFGGQVAAQACLHGRSRVPRAGRSGSSSARRP